MSRRQGEPFTDFVLNLPDVALREAGRVAACTKGVVPLLARESREQRAGPTHIINGDAFQKFFLEAVILEDHMVGPDLADEWLPFEPFNVIAARTVITGFAQ